MESPNTLAKRFGTALSAATAASSERQKQLNAAEKIHVVGAGSLLTAAYE